MPGPVVARAVGVVDSLARMLCGLWLRLDVRHVQTTVYTCWCLLIKEKVTRVAVNLVIAHPAF